MVLRVAIGVNENGEVYGYGISGRPDDELESQLVECDYEPRAFATIEIPDTLLGSWRALPELKGNLEKIEGA